MTAVVLMSLAAALPASLLGVVLWRGARRRGIDHCAGSYLRSIGRRRGPTGPVHLLLCIADHFEPHHGGVSDEVAEARVSQWVTQYPRLFAAFRDSDGRPPRHSFFYPLETYEPSHLHALAELCRGGFGEVEVHLHHDRDTAASLRGKLEDFKRTLASRHGLLSRRRDTGELAYGFIHGDWALDNSRPDGRCCGVNNELDVLRETGCYADFTMPSYPSPTQTRKINSIYYAVDDPLRPRSHDRGADAGSAAPPDGALLLVQGPLLADWRRRKWGVVPQVENGCIQANQPPTAERVDLWLRARVQVAREDWFFVKLHTHGAPEANQRVLLGEAMTRFHQDLARRAREDRDFHFHYVTTREMYNLVRAAESGWAGGVDGARDFELAWNGGSPAAPSGAGSGASRQSRADAGGQPPQDLRQPPVRVFPAVR